MLPRFRTFETLFAPSHNSTDFSIRRPAVGFHFADLAGAVWGIVFSYFSSLPLVMFYSARLGLFDPRKELIALSLLIAGLISGEAFNMAFGLIKHA